MSKVARIRQERKEGRDRRHTVASKETGPGKMHNPENARKKRRPERSGMGEAIPGYYVGKHPKIKA